MGAAGFLKTANVGPGSAPRPAISAALWKCRSSICSAPTERPWFHGRDDAFFIDRYQARFWAPKGFEFGRGENPDHPLASDQPGPVADSTVFLFETANRPEAILRLTRSGGILITCDSLQNWAEADEYFDAPTIKTMGAAGFLKTANVGPGWRNAARPQASDFRRLMEMPFQHLLSAHGTPLLGSAKEAVGTTLAGLYEL